MAHGSDGDARIALARKLALGWRFPTLAWRYWLAVHPLIRCELRQWRHRAAAIPDRSLRGLAFEAHAGKRGNLEGAASFAVFVPPSSRIAAVRALVCFQAAYDYVDVLSEQPGDDTIANGYRLHLALVDALDPTASSRDHYMHHVSNEDMGYLQLLVFVCGALLQRLPSYRLTKSCAQEGARRIAVYQGLNNWGEGGDHRAYARWAAEETPFGTGLHWWETGAAAGSSLSVFAAIAAAADASLREDEARLVDRAYFPWIGSLHTLLDSLVDHEADERQGLHSLVSHYDGTAETASRMGEIARRSMAAAGGLRGGAAHQMIVAAMSCFYLVEPEAGADGIADVRDEVIDALGEVAGPTLLVMRLRERLSSGSGEDAEGEAIEIIGAGARPAEWGVGSGEGEVRPDEGEARPAEQGVCPAERRACSSELQAPAATNATTRGRPGPLESRLPPRAGVLTRD